MSVGDLKTDGLKGNNFPWQLKMLKGLQGIINAIIAIPPTPALSKVPVIERISGTTLTISVAVRSISIACPNTSGGPIDVSTDGGINFVQLFPGEIINYDAGTLNNYFAANLFEIDCTLSPGDALITYII